ncbi:MAG: penicillin acylase family protein, partial [Acidimicrobiales bacterium]|nr:penicillin acylase family protein [Acidimicrobiales bacterium]
MASALLLAASLAACSDSGDEAAPDPDATEVGTSDTYEATIRRTTDGVPHITGDTLGDVAFGQGYASGEDRTCDLADQVVKIRGERARWFGPGDEDANIDSDVQWRAIGIFDLASADWADVGADTSDLFEAYVAGWNAHLDEVGADGV